MHRGMIPSLVMSLSLAMIETPDLAGQDNASVSGSEISPQPDASVTNPSHRPSLRTFATDLADNSLELFSTDNILPLLIGAGTVAATRPADGSVRDFFNAGDRFGVFEELMGGQVGRFPLVFGAVGGLWTVSHFYGSDKFARFSHDLAQASALNGLMTFGLKRAVRRIRPDGSNNLSFPSGHSSTAWTVATIVDHHYGTAASISAYAMASFVAASRLDAGKHYLSDIIAGATLGYVVGRTVTHNDSLQARRMTWMPIVSPGTGSWGIAVSWQFED